MTKKKNPKDLKKRGRKQFDGKDQMMVVQKLEAAFAIGATDDEACGYADISRTAMMEYAKKHPDFLARKHLLRSRPILKAKETVVRSLGNVEDAKWYLERKAKNEFSSKHIIEGGDKPLIDFSDIAVSRMKKYKK